MQSVHAFHVEITKLSVVPTIISVLNLKTATVDSSSIRMVLALPAQLIKLLPLIKSAALNQLVLQDKLLRRMQNVSHVSHSQPKLITEPVATQLVNQINTSPKKDSVMTVQNRKDHLKTRESALPIHALIERSCKLMVPAKVALTTIRLQMRVVVK